MPFGNTLKGFTLDAFLFLASCFIYGLLLGAGLGSGSRLCFLLCADSIGAAFGCSGDTLPCGEFILCGCDSVLALLFCCHELVKVFGRFSLRFLGFLERGFLGGYHIVGIGLRHCLIISFLYKSIPCRVCVGSGGKVGFPFLVKRYARKRGLRLFGLCVWRGVLCLRNIFGRNVAVLWNIFASGVAAFGNVGNDFGRVFRGNSAIFNIVGNVFAEIGNGTRHCIFGGLRRRVRHSLTFLLNVLVTVKHTASEVGEVSKIAEVVNLLRQLFITHGSSIAQTCIAPVVVFNNIRSTCGRLFFGLGSVRGVVGENGIKFLVRRIKQSVSLPLKIVFVSAVFIKIAREHTAAL